MKHLTSQLVDAALSADIELEARLRASLSIRPVKSRVSSSCYLRTSDETRTSGSMTTVEIAVAVYE